MFRELTTGAYKPSPYFQSIPEHAAVCYADDGMLVGVTGPSGDGESEEYARLFAAAPELLAALEYAAKCLLELSNSGDIPEKFLTPDGYCKPLITANAAIAKAKGRP